MRFPGDRRASRGALSSLKQHEVSPPSAWALWGYVACDVSLRFPCQSHRKGRWLPVPEVGDATAPTHSGSGKFPGACLAFSASSSGRGPGWASPLPTSEPQGTGCCAQSPRGASPDNSRTKSPPSCRRLCPGAAWAATTDSRDTAAHTSRGVSTRLPAPREGAPDRSIGHPLSRPARLTGD